MTFRKLRSWYVVPSLHGNRWGKSGNGDILFWRGSKITTLAWKIPWTEEPGRLLKYKTKTDSTKERKATTGGSGTKNPPANAGDMGSIPAQGRSN